MTGIRVLFLVCAGAVLAMFASTAMADIPAQVLTFDDIGPGDGVIPDGYGGLDWDEFGYLVGSSLPGSGYDNGVVSGTQVAFNEYAHVATVDDATFDFGGAYLTSAWNTGLNITVTGYAGGVELYSQTVVVDTTGPTWFNFNYYGIDTLKFHSFGGTDADLGDGGSGEHFAMDNFTIVPTPAAVVLGGIGLGMVGWWRRRQMA